MPLTGGVKTDEAEGPRVTSINYLITGKKEVDPSLGTFGSLNHSINKQYDREDEPGCCRRNLVWICLAIVAIIALSLFINIHYHVGPDSSRLVAYWEGNDASSPANLAISAQKNHEENFARTLQMDLLKGSHSSVHDPLSPGGDLSIPSKIDLSGDQMRAEAMKLSRALDHMNLGKDQLRLPDLPQLPDMPGTLDATAIPDAADLEAELTKKTGGVDDVLTRVEEERAKARLSHLGAKPDFHPHPSALDTPQAEAADAALLRKARLQSEEKSLDDMLDKQAQMEFRKGFEKHRAKMVENIQVMEAHARRLEKEIEEEEAAKLERERHAGENKDDEHVPTPEEIAEAKSAIAERTRIHAERMQEEAAQMEKIEAEKKHLEHLVKVAQKEPTPERRVGKRKTKEEDGEEEEEDDDAPDAAKAAATPARSLIGHNESVVLSAPIIRPQISGASDLTPLAATTFSFHDRSLFPHLRTPPSLKTFPFCYDCPAHCRNVLSSVDWAASHLSSEAQTKKFSGLSESLSRFFRGTTHLFWEVISHPTETQKALEEYSSSTAVTFLNGDLHLLNLGSYDAARFDSKGHLLPEGRLQYDFNDFDHAFLGAQYWSDLGRTMVSVVIGMKEVRTDENDETKGELFTHDDIDTVLHAYTSAYYSSMEAFVDSDLELSYTLDLTRADLPEDSPISKLLQKKHRKKTRVKMLDTFSTVDDGARRLDVENNKKLAEASQEEVDEIKANWKNYISSLGAVHRSRMHRVADKQTTMHSISYHPAASTPSGLLDFYHVKSVARRIGAGLGSMGVARFFVLVEGPTKDPDDDILLDVKYAAVPEWRPFNQPAPSTELFASDALRVVSAANAFSAVYGDDIHIGWLELKGGSFVVRARSPFKGDVDLSDLREVQQWRELAEQVARITAANHARGDDDYDSRLVPSSFEDAFTKHLVPASKREAWSQVMVKHAWEQYAQRHVDYTCWTNEHTRKEKEEEPAAAEE